MASTAVSAAYVSRLTLTAQLDNVSSTSTNSQYVIDENNTTTTLTSSTTPDLEYVAKEVITIASSTGSLDLTAITHVTGETVSLAGKKIRALKFQAGSGNSGATTITSDASGGHDCLGADWKIVLSASDEALFYIKDSSATVANTTSDIISFAGTDDDTIEVLIAAG